MVTGDLSPVFGKPVFIVGSSSLIYVPDNCSNWNIYRTSRKKVRCSGTRPQCFLCMQLDQNCQYSDNNFNLRRGKSRATTLRDSPLKSADVSSGTDNAGGVEASSHDELISKVSSLEAQLNALVHTIQQYIVSRT